MNPEKIRADLEEKFIGRRQKNMPNLPVYAWYFNERERMRIKREDHNLLPPWTDDPILSGFRFTNIHRGDDRVSRDLIAAMHDKLISPELIFNAVIFRTFNTKVGYDAIGGWTDNYNVAKATKRLDKAVEGGQKIWTSAYLMVNSMTKRTPQSPHKHSFYAKVLFKQLWDDRQKLFDELIDCRYLEQAMRIFTRYPGYAEFLGYELALDMEMLGVIDPLDKYTWANPGPGARRGLNFVFGRPKDFTQHRNEFIREMRVLWDESIWFLAPHITGDFDMRCIENGLCETSKYASVLTTGRAKRRYKP